MIDDYEGHTPGPWILEKVEQTDAEHEHYLLIGGNNLLSAIHHGGQEWDEHEANARLIAAAPDLLAEVEHLTYLLDRIQGIAEGTGSNAKRWELDRALDNICAIASRQEEANA